jgi:hypothetical protein
MGEKRGQTEVLKYDFNTARELHVKLENKWYRVTPREFRSWNGERKFVYTQGVEIIHESYEGPIYYWNTNKVCKHPTNGGTQYISYMEREAKIRPTERHLL